MKSEPTFFVDLHRRYADAITELEVRASALPDRTQLTPVTFYQERPHTESSVTVTGMRGNMRGSLPLRAEGLLDILVDNLEIYRRVAESGSVIFFIDISTVPSGATVMYSRIGEAPIPYERTTNIVDAPFQLAKWSFSLVKAGCTPITRTVDLRYDLHPKIAVNLECKRR